MSVAVVVSMVGVLGSSDLQKVEEVTIDVKPAKKKWLVRF